MESLTSHATPNNLINRLTAPCVTVLPCIFVANGHHSLDRIIHYHRRAHWAHNYILLLALLLLRVHPCAQSTIIPRERTTESPAIYLT
jgi:hypothetical protein